MRKKYPKINIITVNFNGKKHLKMLFNSLAKLNYPKDKFRIICVDNVSTDGSVSWIRKNYPKVRIILNDVNNYCKANNLGIKNSDTEFVALVNNDTRVDKDWLIELVKVISQDKKIAGVGSKILTLKGRIQNAGHYELPNFYWGERGAGEENNKYDAIEEISSLCGAAVLYRRSSLLEVGLFDEDFIIYGEDVDISLRLRQKKYKLVFAPQSIVSHRFHGTADQDSSRFYIERNRLLYVAKHYPQQLSAALIGDGYFTVKNSIESLSNLYLVLPEIIMKLVKVHSWDLVKGVVQKLFNEIKKISNLEKDILITKFNAMADDQRKVNIELNEKKVELIQQKAMIEEINKVRLMQEGQKKKQAAEKKIQEEQNRLQNKSTQPKITQLNDFIKSLGEKLRLRIEEVFSKDQQLVERKNEIEFLKKELASLVEQLANSLVAAEENKSLLEIKENDIIGYKEELQNLSGQLRQRMDEVLIKDGKLVEAEEKISSLDAEFLNLSKQLCERIEEIALQDKQLAEQDNAISSLQAGAVAKDSRLMEQEHKINSLDSELQNLSGQLRQRIEEILIKDDNLAQAGEKITYLDTELLNLSKQLCERIEEIALQDKQLAEQANTISSLQAGAVAKDSRLMEQEHKINSLDTELSGIYKSEGYRFILRPFWTLLWNTRGLAREISKKFTQAFWFTTAIALTPVFLFLVACFLIENILGYFLGPLLRRIAAKRKIRSIRDSKVSLVIPNYNGVTYLKECLPSVFAATGFSDGQNEVLVVDDGSKDGSVEFIRENFPGVRLLKNRKNRGFGFTCNRGVKAAKHEIIVLINNDIILTKDFLNPLLRHLQRSEDVFTATPKLYGWDRKTFAWGMHMGHFEKGYIRLWNESEIGSGDKISEASPSIFAIGGAMVFRREDFLWLGGFDAIYRPNCWEDIDISYRAWKRGLKVVYEPSSLMYHKGRATLTYERPKEIKNELLFTWKNITDKQILKEHLNLLPWNLYRNRRPFLKGFFWAINHLPQTLLHRLLERGHILEPEDRKIFNKIMLYYGNFIKRGLNHPSGAKPNILIVSRFLPYPLNMGGRIRIHNLVKSLTDRYNFILLSLIDHRDELAYLPALKEIFTEVYPVHTKSPLGLDFSLRMFYPEQYKHGYSYSQELVDKLKELKETKPIDIIHIESNELLYLVDSAGCLPIVYTEHDSSIFSLGKSYYKKDNQFFWPLLDNLKRIYFHHTQFNKLNKVITLSKRDEYILRRFFPKAEITLVPTGVDLKHFAFKDNAGKTKKLIFVGHYRHYPNEDAAVYFVNKIFPLIRKAMPEVELLLVGSHPTARVENLTQEDNVVLVGQVEDVQPYLNDAAVFVNSIRISAGIKGKVLEAMASGVPVVSTTVGSSGIDARDGEEILIADTPKEFARQVIKLLKDKELRANLIANARDLVENKYSWIKIVSKLDRVYKSLLFDAGYDYPNFYLSEKIIDTTNNLIEHKIEALDDDFVHPEAGPEELHIELTYNCNSKCIMCDLWDHNQRSTKSNRELSLDEIRSFVGESRLLQKSKVVVLSGGEPFLRNDIVDLCGYFSRQIPHSSLGILTNGINTEVILNKTKDVLNRFQPQSLWLGSSLDGLGKEHDKIRGVSGAFSGLCKTINQCKKELPQVKFSVTFTLTPYNIDQLVPAKHFADSEGLDFFAQFVVPKQAREEFIWTPQDLDRADKEIMQIIQEIIAKMGQGANLATIGKIKDQYLVSQLYYWSHLVKYQTNPQRFFKKCVAGAKFAMFNPYGDCYFCPGHKNNAIGNIRQQKFDQLWMSEKARHMRSFIDGNNCHCWLVCTVFPVLEKALSKC